MSNLSHGKITHAHTYTYYTQVKNIGNKSFDFACEIIYSDCLDVNQEAFNENTSSHNGVIESEISMELLIVLLFKIMSIFNNFYRRCNFSPFKNKAPVGNVLHNTIVNIVLVTTYYSEDLTIVIERAVYEFSIVLFPFIS